jgi:hypothetical protein
VWFNTTRMHVWTHLKKKTKGRTGTDNGAEIVSWPDGGCAPFHGEKGMGRRASGAAPPALARCDQAGHTGQRDHRPQRLAADISRGHR